MGTFSLAVVVLGLHGSGFIHKVLWLRGCGLSAYPPHLRVVRNILGLQPTQLWNFPLVVGARSLNSWGMSCAVVASDVDEAINSVLFRRLFCT